MINVAKNLRFKTKLCDLDYKNGFYIDVGCYHPKKHSNTYLLFKKKKWSGINIDIESDKIKTFKLLRPRDENICSPISNKKSYSIKQIAQMFKSKIIYLPSRAGERYASALTNMSLSNRVYKYFGKMDIKDYISDFLQKHHSKVKKY